MAAGNADRSTLALYARAWCPYSHQVRLVLAEKGVAPRIIAAHDGASAQDLADLNPYAEAPTLVDRHLVLYDTRVICEYLDERFPQPRLIPADPIARAKVRLVLSRIGRDWYRPLVELLDGSSSNPAAVRRALGESLAASEELFRTERGYFLGAELSMMDLALAPVLWRLDVAGVRLPASAQAVHTYAERMFARPAFQETLTETERKMRYE